MRTVWVNIHVEEGMTQLEMALLALSTHLGCSEEAARDIARDYNLELSSGAVNDRERDIRAGILVPDDFRELLRARAAVEINNLSQDVREFVFQGGDAQAEIGRQNGDDYLRIANLARRLSPAERAAYEAQTTVDTTNPQEYAQSLEDYIEHLQNVNSARGVRSARSDRLIGVRERVDPIRAEIREVQDELRRLRNRRDQGDRVDADEISRLEERLTELQRRYNDVLEGFDFDDADELEAAEDRFVQAFRDEALLIAGEGLNRAAHDARESEAQVHDRDELARMFEALTPIRERLAEAREMRAEATDLVDQGDITRTVTDPSTDAEASRIERLCVTQVRDLSETWPIFSYGPEEWATAAALARNTRALSRVLSGHIDEVQEGVTTMREALTDDPDLVWALDGLVAEARSEMGIEPGTGQATIIAEEVAEEERAQMLEGLALGVIALGAGLASGGSGTVAVLSGGAAVGIGAYQTWEEFRRYDIQNSANNVGMLTSDPTIAWAVISLIGVGVDAADICLVLREAPDVARAMRGVAEASEDGTEVVGELASAMDRAARDHEALTQQARSAVLDAANERIAQQTAFRSVRSEVNGGAELALETGREGAVAAWRSAIGADI